MVSSRHWWRTLLVRTTIASQSWLVNALNMTSKDFVNRKIVEKLQCRSRQEGPSPARDLAGISTANGKTEDCRKELWFAVQIQVWVLRARRRRPRPPPRSGIGPPSLAQKAFRTVARRHLVEHSAAPAAHASCGIILGMRCLRASCT